MSRFEHLGISPTSSNFITSELPGLSFCFVLAFLSLLVDVLALFCLSLFVVVDYNVNDRGPRCSTGLSAWKSGVSSLCYCFYIIFTIPEQINDSND